MSGTNNQETCSERISSDEEPTIAGRKRIEDSRYLTKRTALHKKKSDLVPEINKALLIQRGARNLLNANEISKINNKTNRVKIMGVLDTESAALGTLKDQMDFLNSDFSTYQNIKTRLPMIPVGLKDSDPINFEDVLSPFITSHYHATPEDFTDALNRLTEGREKVRNARRSVEGLKDFRRYYDFFNTVERRFFDESVRHGFRFSWSDSFTGELHSQRSAAFEKGALIFNFSALCSQIAAENFDLTSEALNEQMHMFLQSRANFQILQESFAHAPSRDMAADVLNFLIRVMQTQAQEAFFMKKTLEQQTENDCNRLVYYIGGASFISERFGQLASPQASGVGGNEWRQVETVIPSSWVRLIDLKSQYYQAQMNYRLAVMLISLALQGKPDVSWWEVPNNGTAPPPEVIGPLPLEGLYTDDGFLETDVASYLGNLFSALKTNIQLHKQTPRERRKAGGSAFRRHRSHRQVASNGGGPTDGRPQSRLRRTLSSLSISSWGRSKSQAKADDSASMPGGRFSSMSSRSAYSSASAPPTGSQANLFPGDDGSVTSSAPAEVLPPGSRKEAHQLGEVCLAEALSWARQALQTLEEASDLNRDADLKDFISRDVVLWSELLDRVRKKPNSSAVVISSTEAAASPQIPAILEPPKPKARGRYLHRSKSNNDSGSVVSTNTSVSRRSASRKGRAKEASSVDDFNPWTAPTFVPVEIELPSDTNFMILKSGRNIIAEGKDPFRLLGPLKYFNARKCWSDPYTVTLERNQEVAYGFSIQGTGPVEILGVDMDTPASDNGLRTSDLVVAINGMDARFMTHNEAVAAIRFGREGYDAASSHGGQSSPPIELDIVEMTLVRPETLAVQRSPPTRRPSSVYLAQPETPVPLISSSDPKVRKHISMRSTQSGPLYRKKSAGSSTTATPPEDHWLHGVSSKLRPHSSMLSDHNRDVFAKCRTSPYT